MNLIYLDESGNTGVNLRDPQQPVFTLCAIVVPERKWHVLDAEIQKVVESFIPSVFLDGFEIHAKDLRNGTGMWKGVSHQQRIACRDALLGVLIDHGVKLFAKSTEKRYDSSWCRHHFGSDIVVNPHIPAHVLLAQTLNTFLKDSGDCELGILIHDENKVVDREIEAFIRILQADTGILKLERILEKGFFINSKQSRLLQMADLCALYIRKDEEEKCGKPITGADRQAVALLKAIRHEAQSDMDQALDWLTNYIKKRSGEGPFRAESHKGGRSRR